MGPKDKKYILSERMAPGKSEKGKKSATSLIKWRLRTPKHSAIQVTLTPETKLQVQWLYDCMIVWFINRQQVKPNDRRSQYNVKNA